MRCVLLFCCLSFIACQKEAIQYDADLQTIREYIQTNSISNIIEDPDAHFFYSMLWESTDTISAVQNAGLKVEVKFKAYFLDGTLLHDSNGQSEIIELDESIYGWQLAIPQMDINDRMLLILPSRLAYGDDGNANIPPNSIIAFEIELIDIFPHF